MKFSLIMATYGRGNEIENFLISLKNQTYKNFELIVIDQNEDDKAYKIIKKFQNDINIIYLKVNFKGLSKARNYGLNYASGQIIAFPDDDCEYPNDLLENVKNFFENNDFEIFSGIAIDKFKNKESLGRWFKKSKKINIINFMRVCPSPCLFIRTKEKLEFDENFGINSKFYSSEETDLVFRLLKKGYKGYFERRIFIYHPYKEDSKERAYYYGIGMGAFFRKHLKNDFRLVIPFVENLIIRPIGGMILNVFRKEKFLKNYYSFKGRWKGFLSYDN
ncbi:MAG: glycosyltransferase family 2 protein [Candidatus Hydrothermia bacterium]|jgi:glycosyltransferase involved in cell wall biosynthesis